MPFTDDLPYALYRAEQVREFDRIAIEEYGIPGAELMERAGSRVFQLLRDRWPEVRHLTLICGAGNNAGDAYVVARLARQAGLSAEVLSLVDPQQLTGDAQRMATAWQEMGGEILPYTGLPRHTGLIVDGILGTGLTREVSGRWAEAIQAINRHPAPVLAIDIPSGLNADSGRVMGCAIEAAVTLSFIGLKQGLFTGQGPDHCGDVFFDALEIPAAVYARQIIAARRIDWQRESQTLEPRRRTGHKGDYGHVLVIGGDQGFSGAARLAAEAAARTGAGLVSVATHPAHASYLNVGRPEIMCRGVEGHKELQPLIARANVIALGPGLGQSEWSRAMYALALAADRPLVVDADGLNWLTKWPEQRDWVLTPHPGEAGRMLGITGREVQADRFVALHDLQHRYGGTVVLKGAGTLIGDGSSHPPALCSGGNPGMATGGSGDVLTGVIAAFIAQGFSSREAAELGVSLHAAAGDRAARNGERGMLAGDILAELRPLLNPGAVNADA